MSGRRQYVLGVVIGSVIAIAHFLATLISFFDIVFGAVAPSHGPNYGAMFTALTFPGSIVWKVFADYLGGNDALFFGTMAGNSIFWGVVVGTLWHRLRWMRKARRQTTTDSREDW